MEKIFKILLISVGTLLGLLLVVFLVCFQKLDDTPLAQTAHFKKWQEIKMTFKSNAIESQSSIKVAWAKVNITPPQPIALAGYGKRQGKSYDKIQDSVYVRVVAIEQASQSTFLLSADMLIVPPNVTKLFYTNLNKVGIDSSQVHISAIHSHNSIGTWGSSLTGELFAGKYNPKMEITLAAKFTEAVLAAKEDLMEGSISYGEINDIFDIRNRLGEVPNPEVDPEIRALTFNRTDGKKAILVTYGAHSTVMDSKNISLSRDYSGMLVDSLENHNYEFAMYMAGAVGSMGPVENGKDDFEELKHQSDGVFSHITDILWQPVFNEKKIVESYLLPLPLREPNPKIFKHWGLRPWMFKKFFGDYPVNIKATRIGNVILIGMPCDFSGEMMNELDDYAKSKGYNLIVTSFNGGYMGYVTDEKRFDEDLYESTTMAWYGNQNGVYFSQVVKDLVDKIGE